MLKDLTERLDCYAKQTRLNELETHLEMQQRGGIFALISYANLRLRYIFRSREEIREQVREEKRELERDIDSSDSGFHGETAPASLFLLTYSYKPAVASISQAADQK